MAHRHRGEEAVAVVGAPEVRFGATALIPMPHDLVVHLESLHREVVEADRAAFRAGSTVGLLHRRLQLPNFAGFVAFDRALRPFVRHRCLPEAHHTKPADGPGSGHQGLLAHAAGVPPSISVPDNVERATGKVCGRDAAGAAPNVRPLAAGLCVHPPPLVLGRDLAPRRAPRSGVIEVLHGNLLKRTNVAVRPLRQYARVRAMVPFLGFVLLLELEP
mmetsp:Transcript_64050/g.178021  ORF Transcript_64050/g.178021 Transcript_64050/m.178021 type:complete len:217 (-) Transcript_64050:512-1162(-)